jgi:hypothetical protein
VVEKEVEGAEGWGREEHGGNHAREVVGREAEPSDAWWEGEGHRECIGGGGTTEADGNDRGRGAVACDPAPEEVSGVGGTQPGGKHDNWVMGHHRLEHKERREVGRRGNKRDWEEQEGEEEEEG